MSGNLPGDRRPSLGVSGFHKGICAQSTSLSVETSVRRAKTVTFTVSAGGDANTLRHLVHQKFDS
jgi:hypothetical protein